MALRRALILMSLASVACGPAVSVPLDTDGSSSSGSESASSATTPDPLTTSTSTSPATTDDEPEPATSEPPGSSTTTAASSESSSDPSASTDGTSTGSSTCGAIDILFVIDSSENFAEVQDRYLAALDGFIEDLTTTFAAQSVHVGFLPTHNGWPFEPTNCNNSGDMLTHTMWAACLPEGGRRFATSEDDDLGSVLPCLLDVGLWSGHEYPVTNTVEALAQDQQKAGACNEGFLRDDAVLGIFYVTNDPEHEDEPDDANPNENTDGWHPAVLAAKDDDPSAIAVVGIVAMDPLDCIWWQVENTNLTGFIDAFGTQGMRASVCDDDWAPTLSAGIELLEQTCAAWDP